MVDLSEETSQRIDAYRKGKGATRNDLLRDKGVLFQKFATDAAILRALGRISYDVERHTVLDIGGGSGGSLAPFMSLGAPACQLTCIDLLRSNIELGRARFPGVRFDQVDARSLPFDGPFDIVCSTGLFLQLDDEVATRIGSEMRRVVRPGGHVLVVDWCFADLRDKHQTAVTQSRIERIVGLSVKFRERGALLPPIGRFLSAYAPWAYFGTLSLLPFLSAMRVYVMKG